MMALVMNKKYHVKFVNHWHEHITVEAKDEDEAIDKLQKAIAEDTASRFYYEDDGNIEVKIEKG